MLCMLVLVVRMLKWQISGDYALEKNIGINMLYGFHVRTHEGNKVNNYYRANLNFKF